MEGGEEGGRSRRNGQEERREDATHYDSCLRCGKNPSDTHRKLGYPSLRIAEVH